MNSTLIDGGPTVNETLMKQTRKERKQVSRTFARCIKIRKSSHFHARNVCMMILQPRKLGLNSHFELKNIDKVATTKQMSNVEIICEF
jgi:hypothetical protein